MIETEPLEEVGGKIQESSTVSEMKRAFSGVGGRGLFCQELSSLRTKTFTWDLATKRPLVTLMEVILITW